MSAFDAPLKQLMQDSSEIKAAALVSVDGIMIASHSIKDVSEDQMAAMSAAMLSLGNRMAGNVLNGNIDRVMIQSNLGYVIITAVGENLLLSVVAVLNAKLAMVFHDIKSFGETIKSIKEEG